MLPDNGPLAGCQPMTSLSACRFDMGIASEQRTQMPDTGVWSTGTGLPNGIRRPPSRNVESS